MSLQVLAQHPRYRAVQTVLAGGDPAARVLSAVQPLLQLIVEYDGTRHTGCYLLAVTSAVTLDRTPIQPKPFVTVVSAGHLVDSKTASVTGAAAAAAAVVPAPSPLRTSAFVYDFDRDEWYDTSALAPGADTGAAAAPPASFTPPTWATPFSSFYNYLSGYSLNRYYRRSKRAYAREPFVPVLVDGAGSATLLPDALALPPALATDLAADGAAAAAAPAPAATHWRVTFPNAQCTVSFRLRDAGGSSSGLYTGASFQPALQQTNAGSRAPLGLELPAADRVRERAQVLSALAARYPIAERTGVMSAMPTPPAVAPVARLRRARPLNAEWIQYCSDAGQYAAHWRRYRFAAAFYFARMALTEPLWSAWAATTRYTDALQYAPLRDATKLARLRQWYGAHATLRPEHTAGRRIPDVKRPECCVCAACEDHRHATARQHSRPATTAAAPAGDTKAAASDAKGADAAVVKPFPAVAPQRPHPIPQAGARAIAVNRSTDWQLFLAVDGAYKPYSLADLRDDAMHEPSWAFRLLATRGEWRPTEVVPTVTVALDRFVLVFRRGAEQPPAALANVGCHIRVYDLTTQRSLAPHSAGKLRWLPSSTDAAVTAAYVCPPPDLPLEAATRSATVNTAPPRTHPPLLTAVYARGRVLVFSALHDRTSVFGYHLIPALAVAGGALTAAALGHPPTSEPNSEYTAASTASASARSGAAPVPVPVAATQWHALPSLPADTAVIRAHVIADRYVVALSSTRAVFVLDLCEEPTAGASHASQIPAQNARFAAADAVYPLAAPPPLLDIVIRARAAKTTPALPKKAMTELHTAALATQARVNALLLADVDALQRTTAASAGAWRWRPMASLPSAVRTEHLLTAVIDTFAAPKAARS